MKSLVTIGLPCFNAERWIAEAIESALAQTWANKEIIVVDDGSTDQSCEILRGFGDKIHLLHTSHRGANHARNAILQEARGEWIQYLDADDYLMPEKISSQLVAAGENDEILYSPVWISENNLRTEGEINRDYDVYAQWLAWQLPQTGGCLWRKETLRRLEGWNEKMPCCQEHELYQRALQAGVPFTFVAGPGAVYRIWSDETLCRKDPHLVIQVKTSLIDQMAEWMTARREWKNVHQNVAGQACFEMARTLAKTDIAEASRYARLRQKRKMFHPTGPAAPFLYRLCFWLFGFSLAEHIAQRLRPARP